MTEIPEIPRGNRAGFTIVEVIVAMVVLTAGVVGLAGTTAWVTRQLTLSRLTTERTAAVQSTIEYIRAQDFDSIGSGADTIGVFQIRWESTQSGSRSKIVRVVTLGPGLSPNSGSLPSIKSAVYDTFTQRIIQR
jgi:prepilin-type N-terminal cleavage/methylation domain-containing protein